MSAFAFVPSSLESRIGDPKITSIHPCAYPPTAVDAQESISPAQPPSSGPLYDPVPKTNHWVIYCATSEGEYIIIDPSPPGPNTNVILIVSRKESTFSDFAKTTTLGANNLTFEALRCLIISSSYHMYRFGDAGQGCRYWTQELLKLLSRNNHLSADGDEVAASLKALDSVWDMDGSLVPAPEQTPVTKGDFYALESSPANKSDT